MLIFPFLLIAKWETIRPDCRTKIVFLKGIVIQSQFLNILQAFHFNTCSSNNVTDTDMSTM